MSSHPTIRRDLGRPIRRSVLAAAVGLAIDAERANRRREELGRLLQEEFARRQVEAERSPIPVGVEL